MPVPAYLKHLAVDATEHKTWTAFSLVCLCGCRRFHLYKNDYTSGEKKVIKPYFKAVEDYYYKPKHIYYDENGVLHDEREVAPGVYREAVIPPAPFFSTVKVYKALCASCGVEHLLFDNRYHGYDGMTAQGQSEELLSYQPHFRQIKRRDGEAVGLLVKAENDETYLQFCENTALGFTEAQYADAFSWICVYTVDTAGKKRKVLDIETA